jgi:hypothetical protein
MSLKIGIENGSEGRTIVWVLEHPGCFSYGENSQEALKALPAALQEYNEWLARHEQGAGRIPHDQDLHIDSTWEVFHIDENFAVTSEGYEVNAWFQDDWKPLAEKEIALGIELLSMSRADLLSTVEGLGEETMSLKLPGERWSIAGILKHVASADWWYLDRLGMAFPSDQIPSEPGERLNMVRTHMVDILPSLAESKLVVGIEGEFWSPRKLLRRAVWHERDHTFHIRKLLKLRAR